MSQRKIIGGAFDRVSSILTPPDLPTDDPGDSFYEHFTTFIHCFDPNLSNLSYLRKHSAFLVSVVCSIGADFHPDPQYRAVSERLGEYVEDMLPVVMSGVYKSVEIAQACYIL